MMRLSEFLDENEARFRDVERAKASKIVEYLKNHIDVDLEKTAASFDGIEIFKKLNVWLLNFYNKEYIEALMYADYDILRYRKDLIFSFILAVTRNRPNVGVLYDVLTSKGIIEGMVAHEDGTFEIASCDFGKIVFRRADSFNDSEVEKYLESLGDKVADGCHEIAFFLIKRYRDLMAVTGICTKALGCKYYHSFVLEDEDVIDLTANLVMPKEKYYLFQEVEELNVTDYEQYLKDEKKSKEYDESGTLFGLLRNALYNEVTKGKQK